MEDRLKSIDVLRGLGTVWMIVFHSLVIFTPMNFGLVSDIIIYAATMFTTFFVLAAGSAFFLFMNKKSKEDLTQIEIFKKVFKRAIFIIIATLTFQLIGGFSGVSAGIVWSLFYDIGISMIILFKVPFLKKRLRYLAYISLFFTFFLLTHLLIAYNIEFLGFLISGGAFPILPWINFFLFGLVIGDFIVNSTRRRYNIDLFIILFIGISLIALWWLWVKEIQYLTIYWFFWGIGTYITLFSIFFYLSDLKDIDIFLQERVIQWGRLTFSIYYLHFAIIITLRYIFNFFILDFEANKLNFYQYIILISIFTLFVDVFIRIWKKYNYKYGLEWIMRKFEKFSLFPRVSGNY